jgi:hypothetical protein
MMCHLLGQHFMDRFVIEGWISILNNHELQIFLASQFFVFTDSGHPILPLFLGMRVES